MWQQIVDDNVSIHRKVFLDICLLLCDRRRCKNPILHPYQSPSTRDPFRFHGILINLAPELAPRDTRSKGAPSDVDGSKVMSDGT